MDHPSQFDAAERAEIVAEYRRVASERIPPSYAPVGCLLILIAVVGLF